MRRALVVPCACALSLMAWLPTTVSVDAHDDRIRAVESGLLERTRIEGAAPRTFSIAERMRFYRVPAVSIAVIDNGKVAWARAYGQLDATPAVPADTGTLFQAGSISKPVTAAAVLRLVEHSRLSLDEDVNRYLTSWHLPVNRFTEQRPVTLRRVLAHTAALTVCCYKGYAPGLTLPKPPQILDGIAPATTAPVRVDTTPGAIWRYSGGGYVLVQQLLEDVGDRAFASLMSDVVLKPAGLPSSTFEQDLPPNKRARAARGHHMDGSLVRGGWYAVPEAAAGGLWATASDLARFVVALQSSFDGRERSLLSKESAEQMMTRGLGNWGLGVELDGERDNARFLHFGGTEGYRSLLVGFLRRGQGVVFLTSGNNGDQLFSEILRSVARVYEWPAYAQRTRAAITVDRAIASRIVGRYRLEGTADSGTVVITMGADGSLEAEIPVWGGWVGPRRMYASAPDEYFFREHYAELKVVRQGDGTVSEVRLSGFSQPYRARRQ